MARPRLSKTPLGPLAIRPLSTDPCDRQSWCMSHELRIVGGPAPISVLQLPGDLYRWKVQNGTAEQHVYVQITENLRPEAVDEPLRSGIESKGETVLRKILETGTVPTRIKITSAGVTQVGIDRKSRPCPL
jgi:hypothetical protein